MPAGFDQLSDRLHRLAEQMATVASSIELVFVTNLRDEPPADVGSDGLLQLGQYYTLAQVDQVIRSFQEIGVTVTSFFSEPEFIAAAVAGTIGSHNRTTVVYTAAEGGTGAGRRALIPALCNLMGLPVLNSGPHACSIARHKLHANAVLAQAGLRVPPTWMFGASGWHGGRAPTIGTRVIMKPTYESSAIGVGEDSVQVVDETFAVAVSAKLDAFQQPIIVQEFISGEEITIPLIRVGKTHSLPTVAVRRADGSPFGDAAKTFAAAFLHQDVSYADYSESVESSIYGSHQNAASKAFDELGMEGVGRMDFRVDSDGRGWLIDTNEAPPPLLNSAFGTSVQMLGLRLDGMLSVWLGACLLQYGLIQESDQNESSDKGIRGA